MIDFLPLLRLTWLPAFFRAGTEDFHERWVRAPHRCSHADGRRHHGERALGSASVLHVEPSVFVAHPALSAWVRLSDLVRRAPLRAPAAELESRNPRTSVHDDPSIMAHTSPFPPHLHAGGFIL